MDIDVMGKHIGSLLAFKDKIEAMIAGEPATAGHSAPSGIDELMAFKSDFEAALPVILKAVADVAVVEDDFGKLKADLAPVLAWVAEQQKAAEVATAEAAEPADAPKHDDAPQGEEPAEGSPAATLVEENPAS